MNKDLSKIRAGIKTADKQAIFKEAANQLAYTLSFVEEETFLDLLENINFLNWGQAKPLHILYKIKERLKELQIRQNQAIHTNSKDRLFYFQKDYLTSCDTLVDNEIKKSFK